MSSFTQWTCSVFFQRIVMKAFLLICLALLIVPSLVNSEALRTASTPGGAWMMAPEKFLDARWDVEKLEAAKSHWEAMRQKKTSIALFVVDSGYVVLALCPVDKPLKCHSVRKSFLNSLYGVLDSKGSLDLDMTLKSLNINDLTPLNSEEKKATIRDLMKCRSGVYLPAEAETSAMRAKKLKRGSYPRDSFYYYSNWDFNVLGGIYRKLTGSDIFLDFSTEIASPLGMQDFDYEMDTYYWHNNEDNPQSAYPAYHFNMSVRDRARFGLLFLRNGKWNDEQVISGDWIKSTSTDYSNHETDPEQLADGKGNGLLWWVSDTGWLYGQKFEGQPYSARGVSGQFIAVVPSENLIITHANDTSAKGWEPSGEQRNKLVELIAAAKK